MNAAFGLQAIIFRRNPRYDGDPVWTPRQAEEYLADHNIVPIKSAHITKNFIRYRISRPTLYKKFYTVNQGDGVLSVIGIAR
jgi:hypothetical protein